MSKYTTEVRFICETAAGLTESAGFNDVENVVTMAAPKIFTFNFPMFDEAYRMTLEKKILMAFYTREISEETVGLWKLRMSQKLNLIMPYYNELYKSTLLKFNPLYDVDLYRTHERKNEGTSTSQTSGKQSSNYNGNSSTNGNTGITQIDLYSDTPQGSVNGLDLDMGNAASNEWLTNARKISSDGTSKENSSDSSNSIGEHSENGSANVNNTEEYIEHVAGKQGNHTYVSMIKEFRENILNIDAMIIGELEPLFFGLWE